MEKGEYRVVGLDADGCEVAGGMLWDNLASAKRNAKALAKEPEALLTGMHKVEVRDYLDDCVADYFVANYGARG